MDSNTQKLSSMSDHIIKEYSAIILGAGISGLVSASVLARQGSEKILVIDSFKNLGGNHQNHEIGPYTFDVGSLIFQDDSPLLMHFPELLPLYIVIDPTWGKLTPQGVVSKYPLSLRQDILSSGLLGAFRIFRSLLISRISRKKIDNARDFASYWIGDELLVTSGLESYLTRFFGVDAKGVDLDFAEKRMLWIKENASLRSIISKLFTRKHVMPTNRQLARPRAGFHELYSVAAEELKLKGVTFYLGCDVSRISKEEFGFNITSNDGKVFRTRRIISTIPIEKTAEFCGISANRKLSSVTLISLFFSFSGQRRFDCSILYNFSHTGFWKRLTMYSDFYGRQNGREYFCVEVISSWVEGNVDSAEQDFRAHVEINKLFEGELTLEGSASVPFAYPIYVNNAQGTVDNLLEALSGFGIESFGRQGGFDYQPTARVSTLVAEDKLQEGNSQP